MEKSLFTSRFRKALLREAGGVAMMPPDIDPAADNEALMGSIKNPADAQQLTDETESIEAVPSVNQDMVTAEADKWSEKLGKAIEIIKGLHSALAKGPLSTIGADVPGIAKVLGDLGKLQQLIPASSKDAAMKQNSERKT